jgi:transcriptional regulator with XRE-family HTH domain
MDGIIGRRLRSARVAAEIGQVELAAEIRITFQQIQKYESGKNRVSAARLFEICRILDVSIASMFEE